MKRYDVFEIDGGYGVAQGIYNNSHVVGTTRWFEKKEEAEEYAKNKKAYDKALEKFDEEAQYKSIEEIEDTMHYPTKEEFGLNVGILI